MTKGWCSYTINEFFRTNYEKNKILFIHPVAFNIQWVNCVDFWFMQDLSQSRVFKTCC